MRNNRMTRVKSLTGFSRTYFRWELAFIYSLVPNSSYISQLYDILNTVLEDIFEKVLAQWSHALVMYPVRWIREN